MNKHSYDEPHRYYHNEKHINECRMFLDGIISKVELSDKDISALKEAILFHDIVYDPLSNTNEEDSVEYYKNSTREGEYNPVVCDLIMVTKTLKPKNYLEMLMIIIDYNIFLQNHQRIREYNYGIFKEYQMYSYLNFIVERKKWFQFAKEKLWKAWHYFCANEIVEPSMSTFITNTLNDIEKGIDIAYNMFISFVPKIGVYVGSFNPFHIGHLHIVEKAEKVFDKVVIVQAQNTEKEKSVYKLPYLGRECRVYSADFFINDILNDIRSGFEELSIIRGIRTGTDLIAEQAYMQTIKELGCTYNITYFLCDPEFQHISSSMIRSAGKIPGVDINRYLPPEL